MKIAVTAIGETIDSPVDQRFGRARYFLLHDSETGNWSVHSNQQNALASQGAGVQAAQTIINKGASILITGHCGPKAFKVLKAGNIAIYQNGLGSVKEVVRSFLAGNMMQSEGPDVKEHFGST